MSDTKVIILKETLGQSVARDVVSVGSLTLAVGLGVYLDSSALQWVAGLMWLFVFFAKVYNIGNDKKKTIEQARTYLDELEKAGE